MPDWALKHELEHRGCHLHMLYIREEKGKVVPSHFSNGVRRLRAFLRQVPKPCACFTTSVHSSYLFYRACNEENLEVLETYLHQNGLYAQVDLAGSRCDGVCTEGPNVTIDGHRHRHVDRETLIDLLNETFGVRDKV